MSASETRNLPLPPLVSSDSTGDAETEPRFSIEATENLWDQTLN